MHTVEIVISFFLLLIASNILGRIVPKLPLPLIQIVLGVLIGLFFPHAFVRLDTEVFLALIVAPLLFRDGQKFDLPSAMKHKYLMVYLAFGVVFLTVFSLGLTLKGILPFMPLAACFAIGASLGPTDVIAAGSVSGKLDFPKRVNNIIKGEGLINDASGLIAFRFAILALTAGEFSVIQAGEAVLLTAIGGAAVGFILGTVTKFGINFLEELDAKDVRGYLLIELFLPFIAYFIAEEVHVSGIIAAVVCGVLQASRFKQINLFDAQVHAVSGTVWETVNYSLNAAVFLLLGIELQHVFAPTWLNPTYSNVHLILAILALTVMLFLTRFVCLCGYYFIISRRRKQKFSRYMSDALMITFSGVKGTVSIATVLLTPEFISKGVPLAERSVMLFLTSGVTLLSFFVGILVLPRLAPMKQETKDRLVEIGLLEDVVVQLEADLSETKRKKAMNAAIDNYRSRIQELVLDAEGENVKRELQELRLMVLQIEQTGLEAAYKQKQIDEASYDLYLQYTRKMERMIVHRFVASIHYQFVVFRRFFYTLFHRVIDLVKKTERKKLSARTLTHDQRKAMRAVFYMNTEHVLRALESLEGVFDSALLDFLQQDRIRQAELLHERNFVDRVIQQDRPNNTEEMMRGYYLERKFIFEYEELGLLTKRQAQELRKNVNTLESYSLQENYSQLPYEFFEYIRQSEK